LDQTSVDQFVTYEVFPTTSSSHGGISFITYCPRLGGWLAGGWIGFDWDDRDEDCTCTLIFGDGEASAIPIVCIAQRADVKNLGVGVLLFIPAPLTHQRVLYGLALKRDGTTFSFAPTHPQEFLDEMAAIDRARSMRSLASHSNRWDTLTRLLDKPQFAGLDTQASFQPVFLNLDGAYSCPPRGLLLCGWLIDPFYHVGHVAIRCGYQSTSLDPKRWITVPRPDVRDEFASAYGGLSLQSGFIAFVDNIDVTSEAPYAEIETVNGETIFKRIPIPQSCGLDTIKQVLSLVDLRYQELIRGYDEVIGPAITAINNSRRKRDIVYRTIDFGERIIAPRCSIIVALHGRIDFMELQLAFFSQNLSEDHEIIYVLDDPSKIRLTETLAESCIARFQRAFRLVMLAENVGYAPANNIGLAVASADYVCFLNSDVFPSEEKWLEYMLSTAKTQSDVGVVGALLLFEDGTVQHEGCIYEKIPEFGGWTFSAHPRKGRVRERGEPVRQADAVTGACLLMRTDLARQVGGFDEDYVIGDFEDMDLCEKVKLTGQVCVVDHRAVLYHLERQSQGNHQMPWRLNLTLYNAWVFQRRWVSRATAKDAEPQSNDQPFQ
jgi:GT2 family glycosyltransferase